MSAVLSYGIVIKKFDFEDEAEIITILTSDGIETLIALGVRKIESKNRYALQLGNLIEFSFFKARLSNKLSKLKKATILMQADITNSSFSLLLPEILWILNKIPKDTIDCSKIVSSYKNLTLENGHHLKTYLAFLILESIGLKQQMGYCIECYKIANIISYDLKKGGFICNKHYARKMDISLLKAFKNLGLGFEEYLLTSNKVNLLVYDEIKHFITLNT